MSPEAPNPPADADLLPLLARAKRGEDLALSLLLARFHDQLLHRIESQLPAHLNRLCWGDDCLAETFACAAGDLPNFSPLPGMPAEQSLLLWLTTIAEHRVIDLIRRESALKRPPPELRIQPPSTAGSDGAFASILHDKAPSPSRSARIDELNAAIRDAMDRLEPSYREVLELRLTMGLSTAQIAARLSRTEGAIRKLISRAIQNLREEIGDPSKYLSAV